MAILNGEIVAQSCIRSAEKATDAQKAADALDAICVAEVKETGQGITFTGQKAEFALGDKVTITIAKV